MKILQVTAPGEFKLLDLPVPEPGPDEVLIRIEAVTTCPQWDLHLKHNEPMFVGHGFVYPYPPGQPGHEATGFVTRLGPGVREFTEGDRVSVWRDPGHDRPGAYAQFVSRPVTHLMSVPSDLPPEAVAPLELAMCVAAVFRMLQAMNALAGRKVGITGLGPAGLIAGQMSRAAGAGEVIGFDPSELRRQMALTLGFDRTLDPASASDGEYPSRPARPALETSIDCVGAKRSVEYLMDRTQDVVALFGVQREDYTFAPRHYSGLRLCGYQGHSRPAAEYALDLISTGRLKLAPLSTHHLALEDYNEALELLESQQATKVCFWPWRDPVRPNP